MENCGIGGGDLAPLNLTETKPVSDQADTSAIYSDRTVTKTGKVEYDEKGESLKVIEKVGRGERI